MNVIRELSIGEWPIRVELKLEELENVTAGQMRTDGALNAKMSSLTTVGEEEKKSK